MEEQTGKNLCVNVQPPEGNGVFTNTYGFANENDCLDECNYSIQNYWSFYNEDDDICCMHMTNTIDGEDYCYGVTGTIESQDTRDIYHSKFTD